MADKQNYTYLWVFLSAKPLLNVHSATVPSVSNVFLKLMNPSNSKHLL